MKLTDTVKLTVILAPLVLLSGCLSLVAPTKKIPNNCPEVPYYSQSQLEKIEKELIPMRDDSALTGLVHDYMDLIEKVKACNKIYKK